MQIVPSNRDDKNKSPQRRFVWWYGVVTLIGSALIVLAFFTYRNPIIDDYQINSLISSIEALVGIVLVGLPFLLHDDGGGFFGEDTIVRLNNMRLKNESSYLNGMFNWFNTIWPEIITFVLIILFTIYCIFFY